MRTITEFSGVVLRRARATGEQKVVEGVEEDKIVEALGETLGIDGDRLERLLEAIELIGDELEKVRLVRVYQGEEGPPKAKSKGEFHYLIDWQASAAPPRRGRDDRRGGGRDGRPGGPPRGGPGGGRDRDPSREREPRGKDVPSGGSGWTLQRAPSDDGGRGGRGRGGPPGRGRGRKPGPDVQTRRRPGGNNDGPDKPKGRGPRPPRPKAPPAGDGNE